MQSHDRFNLWDGPEKTFIVFPILLLLWYAPSLGVLYRDALPEIFKVPTYISKYRFPLPTAHCSLEMETYCIMQAIVMRLP